MYRPGAHTLMARPDTFAIMPRIDTQGVRGELQVGGNATVGQKPDLQGSMGANSQVGVQEAWVPIRRSGFNPTQRTRRHAPGRVIDRGFSLR